MAPVRKAKRASGANATVELKVPIQTSSPSTPKRSPIRRRRGAITLQQKQALIDNLQLEITERARRLRAQYNLQAQGLRSRIEIRINRIPMSLRKLKMGDLLLKFQEQEEKRAARPPVPAKDHSGRSRGGNAGLAPRTGRGQKRMSDAIMGDKENEFEHAENTKKRIRAAPTTEARAAAILSPTSSNSRLAASRSRPLSSPAKSSGIARPASPLKSSTNRPAATSVLSSMVEKAKATRTGTSTRKMTTTSNTSSSSNNTAALPPTRTKRAATTSRVPASRPATRNGRRISSHSETSEASTGTVVKRGAAAKAAPTKKGVMSSIRKGVTGGTKKTTTKTAASTATSATGATGTGRVLRKRN